MGAGDFPAGMGPAGLDPFNEPSVTRNVRPPAALRFDLRTRDFITDANGLYVSIHPVDQKVGLALGLIAGTIASDPTLGNKVRTMKYAGGPSVVSTVRDFVQQALSNLLAAKEIELVAVKVDPPLNGSIVYAVEYVNLALLADNKKTAKGSL